MGDQDKYQMHGLGMLNLVPMYKEVDCSCLVGIIAVTVSSMSIRVCLSMSFVFTQAQLVKWTCL